MSSSPVLGQFLWHELLTTDPAAGAGFYSKVFGWNAGPFEGNADYAMLANANGPVGGVRVVGKDPLADKVGLNWLTYVGVPDLTAALATVEAKGWPGHSSRDRRSGRRRSLCGDHRPARRNHRLV